MASNYCLVFFHFSLKHFSLVFTVGKAGLVMNSYFVYLEMSSFLIGSFAEYNIFACQVLFFLSALWIFNCTAFWYSWFSVKNWQLIWLKIPRTWWFVLSCYFQDHLCAFDSLITVSVDIFEFIVLGVCWTLWICRCMYFIKFGIFFLPLFLQILFLTLSPFLFPLNVPCTYFGMLDGVLQVPLTLFIFLSFFLSAPLYNFNCLIFNLLKLFPIVEIYC